MSAFRSAAVAFAFMLLLVGPVAAAPQDATAVCLPHGAPCAEDVECCGVCTPPTICDAADGCHAACAPAEQDRAATDDAAAADDNGGEYLGDGYDDDGGYEELGKDELQCAAQGGACSDGADCCEGHACLDCATAAKPQCGMCVKLALRSRIPLRPCCRKGASGCRKGCGKTVGANRICWRPACPNVYKRCRGSLKCTSAVRRKNGRRVTVGVCKSGSSRPRFRCAAPPSHLRAVTTRLGAPVP